MTRLAFALLCLAGCTVDRVDGERFRCRTDRQCADGFVCHVGQCSVGPILDAAPPEPEPAPDAATIDLGPDDAAPYDAAPIADGGPIDAGIGPDPDEDGIGPGDNCPDHPNPLQLDRDDDGFGDRCDPCPGVPGTDCDHQCADGPGVACLLIGPGPVTCGVECTRLIEATALIGTCSADGACFPDPNADVGIGSLACPLGDVCLSGPAGEGRCAPTNVAETIERCGADPCLAQADGSPCPDGRCVAEFCCAWEDRTPGCNEQGPRYGLGITPAEVELAARFVRHGAEGLRDDLTGIDWLFTDDPYDGLAAAHRLCAGKGMRLPSIFELHTITASGRRADHLIAVLEPLLVGGKFAISRTVASGGPILPLAINLLGGGDTRPVVFDDDPEIRIVCVDPPVRPRDATARELSLVYAPTAAGWARDPWTGLIWLANSDSGPMPWNGDAHCAGLGGRAPSVGEAASVFQPNPEAVDVSRLAAPEVNRNDWLDLVDFGFGITDPVGRVSPDAVFFARPDVPGGAHWRLDFLSGAIHTEPGEGLGSVRCLVD